MEGKYLITTDGWFYAPDGMAYSAVWGDVEIVEDTFLGVKTNRNSANWFAKVGTPDNHVIVAGCQIHYAIKCETKPNIQDVEDQYVDTKLVKYTRPTRIYIAE